MLGFDPTNTMLVFMRGSALMASFPVLSGPQFPVRFRVALAAILAVLITPALPPVVMETVSLWSVVWLMIKEVCVGLLFGFIARMVFFAIDFAGTFISTEVGLNMAAQFNPLNASRSDLPSVIIYYLAAMIMFSLDLHHWILAAFQESYRLLPIGVGLLTESVFANIITHTGNVFLLAVQMAAPVIAVCFLINLVFSLLGRAVPQMNVFAESFAFRTIGGLGVFGLSLNLMSQHISNYLGRVPEDILRVAQLLSGK